MDRPHRVHLRRYSLDAEDNLLARKHVTQVRILKRATDTLIVIMAIGAVLVSFDQVRQYGASLFASAGVAGLAVGPAARPLLSNLIAGVQIAVAQPTRLDDVVVIEGEYGTIEEIASTYVVIKLWDWRRMVVPLSYFIEKPFQNWTRETSAIIGAMFSAHCSARAALLLPAICGVRRERNSLPICRKNTSTRCRERARSLSSADRCITPNSCRIRW